MTFQSGADFYDAIENSDLYSEEKCLYVFLYNDAGAVCVYSIQKEEAEYLEVKAKEHDEYWGAFLGIGGEIYDDPMEFCDKEYTGIWRSV